MGETNETGDREAHLERSRRVWDRWSGHYGLSESDFEPLREEAIARLGLESGDAVLDVGCGPGVNLASLREAVGPEGRIVAVDYSAGMVERARERIDRHGWTNVAVRRADATTATYDREFDAALATLSLSVMPDPAAAIEGVHDALRPGGRFAVFGLRPVPDGPLAVVNPLLRQMLRYIANWNPDADVVGSLEATFETTDVVETYAAGIGFIAVAHESV